VGYESNRHEKATWHPMSTSLFIRSYRGDFEWLRYCVRSIRKFVAGFESLVLVIPDADRDLLPADVAALIDRLHFRTEQTHGYVDQQITKLRAHYYTTSQRILFVDSDCVFLQPCTVDDFTRDGKPLLLKTAYEVFRRYEIETGNRQDKMAVLMRNCLNWKKVTENIVGFPVEFEYMRRVPIMHLKDTLIYIGIQYPNLINEAVRLRDNSFSEFNIMGAIAEKYFADRYVFSDTETEPLPPKCCEQYWSWGGISNELKETLECVCK
jgi:hypothetical protein